MDNAGGARSFALSHCGKACPATLTTHQSLAVSGRSSILFPLSEYALKHVVMNCLSRKAAARQRRLEGRLEFLFP
jgi:hypothetical protein